MIKNQKSRVQAMGNKKKMAVASMALAMAVARVSAHHSFGAVFDATKPITLTGTVTKVERVNPHGWIYVDVKQPDGTVKNWVIETGSPQELARRGILKETLPIGTELVIQGYRAKDGSNTANGNLIKLPDGRELSVVSSSSNAPGNKPKDDKSGGEAPY